MSTSNSKKYSINKKDMLLLIMDYLREEGYDRSYISLEEESGINLYNYDSQIDLLRKLILDGEWEEVEKFLTGIKQLNNFPYNALVFEIKKEKIIEEIELQQSQGEVEGLVQELKDIQSLGMEAEFNKLLNYLKMNEEENTPKTNIISRRLNTFNIIRQNLMVYFPLNENENLIQQGKMKNIINKVINKIIPPSGLNKEKGNELTIDEFEAIVDIREDALKENNINNVNRNNSDSKTNLKNNNSSGKKSANKGNKYVKSNKNNNNNSGNTPNKSGTGNSGSYQKDTLEIEKNKDVQITGSNQNTTDKKSKANDHDRQSSKRYTNEFIDDLDLNLQIQNEVENSNVVSKSINFNNDLSDLDQEEYYMKNCYDFYNYDITSLKIKKIIDDAHPIRCCCFSPKGDYFAIGTNSKSIKIYDLNYILENFTKKNFKNDSSIDASKTRTKEKKEIIGMIFEQKNHHYGSIYCIDWSSSGKLLATGSNDKTIKLMNIPELDNSELLKDNETLELQITGIKGIVRSLCFEPTNDLVLLSANQGDNLVRLWDTEKGVNVSNFEGHGGDVNVVKWSNDSQLCASSALDKTIRFWDLRESKMSSLLSGIKYADVNDISIFTKHKGGNSTLIAAGHVDGLITIWDYSKRCVIKEINEHNEEVRAVSFSPDGKYLISGSFDSKIKLFDVNNDFQLLGELNHNDRVVSAKWHPEIPLIVTTSADKTARVWIPEKC